MKKFKKIYIEITNVCNLACSFCPKTHRKPEFMDTELFCRILSEIQGYTKHVYFHVLGEPLLHPQLKNFLDISGEFGIKVNITTNGTLIYNKKEELLNSTSLRQVNFSLHSFEADRESCGAKEYLDGIFDFIDTARNKSSVFISLRLLTEYI